MNDFDLCVSEILINEGTFPVLVCIVAFILYQLQGVPFETQP
jgi:hypothetical protein